MQWANRVFECSYIHLARTWTRFSLHIATLILTCTSRVNAGRSQFFDVLFSDTEQDILRLNIIVYDTTSPAESCRYSGPNNYLSRNLAICTVIQYIRLKWKYHNPCKCATYCVSSQFYWFLLLSLSSVSNAPISQEQAKVQFSYFVMVRQNWIILNWLHLLNYPHSLLHNFQYARIVSCGLEVKFLF